MSSTKVRCRNWAPEEKKLFANVLEPKWYKILNPVFTETIEDLEITWNSADVSFSLNEGDDESGISEK